MSTGGRMDGIPVNCAVVYRALAAGMAAPCPSNDCTGIRAIQGPGGTTVIQQWVPPEYWSSASGFVIGVQTGYWKTIGTVRAPDFYQFQLNAGTIVGWTGTLTIDRYGNRYWAPVGVNLGKSVTRVSGSMTAGWMGGWDMPPPPSALKGFLSGFGCSAGGGYWGGLSFDWSSGGQAIAVGLVSPQGGISCGYAW